MMNLELRAREAKDRTIENRYGASIPVTMIPLSYMSALLWARLSPWYSLWYLAILMVSGILLREYREPRSGQRHHSL